MGQRARQQVLGTPWVVRATAALALASVAEAGKGIDSQILQVIMVVDTSASFIFCYEYMGFFQAGYTPSEEEVNFCTFSCRHCCIQGVKGKEVVPGCADGQQCSGNEKCVMGDLERFSDRAVREKCGDEVQLDDTALTFAWELYAVVLFFFGWGGIACAVREHDTGKIGAHLDAKLEKDDEKFQVQIRRKRFEREMQSGNFRHNGKGKEMEEQIEREMQEEFAKEKKRQKKKMERARARLYSLVIMGDLLNSIFTVFVANVGVLVANAQRLYCVKRALWDLSKVPVAEEGLVAAEEAGLQDESYLNSFPTCVHGSYDYGHGVDYDNVVSLTGQISLGTSLLDMGLMAFHIVLTGAKAAKDDVKSKRMESVDEGEFETEEDINDEDSYGFDNPVGADNAMDAPVGKRGK